jgi:hypothetical protein
MTSEYETIGRLYHEKAMLLEEYRKLLQLLLRVQTGEVPIERVAILPNDAWEIRPEGVPPEALKLPTAPPTE